jgi:hypothetical protein
MNSGMTTGTVPLPIKPEYKMDVDEVLNPSYLPTTSAEYDLFQVKQKYFMLFWSPRLKLQKVRPSFVSMKANSMPKRHIMN